MIAPGDAFPVASDVPRGGIDVIGHARKRFATVGENSGQLKDARAKVQDLLGRIARRDLDFSVCRRVPVRSPCEVASRRKHESCGGLGLMIAPGDAFPVAVDVPRGGVDLIGHARKRFATVGQDSGQLEDARPKVQDLLGRIARRDLDFSVCRRVPVRGRYEVASGREREPCEGCTDDYSQ